MIIGHRTKPDPARTVVFKVTFPIFNEDGQTDTHELSREDTESAILSRIRFDSFCRKQTLVDIE
jgi:hypothetical protein